MRVPELPQLEQFKRTLDSRLRAEAAKQTRVVFPRRILAVSRRLRALIKPLLQSGAMAMTAIVIIIAISAAPAATTGDLEIPLASPLAAPNVQALTNSDAEFFDLLPADDVLAVQKPDNSDIVAIGME